MTRRPGRVCTTVAGATGPATEHAARATSSYTIQATRANRSRMPWPPKMRVHVENGLAGCRLAHQLSAVAVVVDALRASATLTSLFAYGTTHALVVREVEEAFAERRRRPGALLVGERGGPMVPGFDLGNSPLREPPARPIQEVIFSSSNCSRCCVGVVGVPAAFLGTTVNARAVARACRQAALAEGYADIVLVTAGSAEDESMLTAEDHIASGAIIAALQELDARTELANDRAAVCQALFGDGDPGVVTEWFRTSQNGRRLRQLGLGEDVEFASRIDVFNVAPRVVGEAPVAGGGRGALLTAGHLG